VGQWTLTGHLRTFIGEQWTVIGPRRTRTARPKDAHDALKDAHGTSKDTHRASKDAHWPPESGDRRIMPAATVDGPCRWTLQGSRINHRSTRAHTKSTVV